MLSTAPAPHFHYTFVQLVYLIDPVWWTSFTDKHEMVNGSRKDADIDSCIGIIGDLNLRCLYSQES